MPEESTAPQPSISQPLGKHSRNWKKILLIALILGVSISLVGVGIYFIGTGSFQLPSSQKQVAPSAETKKPHPLSNKIIFTKTLVTDEKYTASWGVELTKTDKDIYAINPDGSGESKIFDLEPEDRNTSTSKFTLSPKNTYLAWARNTTIFYIKPNQKTQKEAGKIGPIVNIERNQLWSYSISPDETKIAVLIVEDQNTKKGSYTSLRVRILKFPSGELINDFYTAKGTGKADETIPGQKNPSPDWIDNSTIVVYSREKSDKYFASYDISKESNSKKVFVRSWGRTIINKSKTKIVYAERNNEGLNVLLANIDGSNKKIVSTLSSPVVPTIKFSPNDKFLAFCHYTGTNKNLHIIDLVKKEETKITTKDNACMQGEWESFVWSVDNKKLLVGYLGYKNIENEYPPALVTKLSIVNLDGKVVKDLTSSATLKSQGDEIGSVSRYSLIGLID